MRTRLKSGAARPRRLLPRAAFTLLEMMLAVTMLLLVFAMTFPLFRSQLRAMGTHAGRLDAQQNVRFAVSTIEQQLRIAGAGVPDKQPMIVQVSPYALTFNADLATRDTASEGGAFGAVYLDTDLPVGSTMSMTPETQITLPLSSKVWPWTTYYRGGGPQSAAETISFWVAPDASPGSNGRYALFRRVNAMPIDTLARGLVMDGTDPFTYQTLDQNGLLQPVPDGSLPAYHVAIHGSPADTGSSALTDAIRFVKIHLVGSFIDRDGSTTQRLVEANVRLLNAGLLNHATCGDPPVFAQTVTASYVGPPAPTPQVVLSWQPAVDETGGEKDVQKYVIWRRAAAAPAFAEPFASVPAGQASYQFSDTQIASHDQWIYGVAAEDCGGQFSPVAVTNQVNIP